MSHHNIPKWYNFLKEKFPRYIAAVENLGEVAKNEGPLDGKTIHLIKLGAAAAIRSEGSIHSHVRRALENSATKEDVYHALISLTSTIGFPNVAAALNWADDELKKY